MIAISYKHTIYYLAVISLYLKIYTLTKTYKNIYTYKKLNSSEEKFIIILSLYCE